MLSIPLNGLLEVMQFICMLGGFSFNSAGTIGFKRRRIVFFWDMRLKNHSYTHIVSGD